MARAATGPGIAAEDRPGGVQEFREHTREHRGRTDQRLDRLEQRLEGIEAQMGRPSGSGR